MKNQRKRLAVLLGVTMLTVSQAGNFVVRAEEHVPQETANDEGESSPEDENVPEETEDSGKEKPSQESGKEESITSEADNQQPALEKATDLTWETDQKGYATFVIPNEKGTASYKVDLYHNGDWLRTYADNAYGDKEKGAKIELFFFHFMTESGTYKFQVTTLDTNKKPVTQNFSSDLSVTLADGQLPVPQDVTWNEEGNFSCRKPDHDQFLQYVFEVYRPDGNIACNQFGSPYAAQIVTVTENEDGITFNLNEYLSKQGVTVENGYSVRVQATSKNFEECRDSDWSDRIIYNQASSKPETPSDNSVTQSDSSSSSNEDSGSTATVRMWEPTTPDEIRRYAAFSREKVVYTADSVNAYSVVINNAMQGKLCFDSFEAVLGDYTIGRTYDITPSNNKDVYKMDSRARITLSIPESLQAEGREYKMICVTEKGQPVVLDDLDSSAATITFETDTYHAFALVYRNAAAAQ